jgi:protein SCO1
MQRRAWMAGMLALALAACEKKKQVFKATDISGANYGQGLSLTDQDGKVRTLADFKGKLAVIFFGFTQCPDVCPTTMAELAQAKKLLGADGDKVQGIFITVDPERDTPEILKSYATAWDPSFIALRGTPEQTAATAKDFKVFYSKVPGKEPGSYTVDHSAASFVFDTQGQLRLYVRYGAGAEALASDLKALLAG